MSKAVLMSIQPKWCELIANGKKTVEVRKTKPKLETPFKVYIYCTKPKNYYRVSGCLTASDECLWLSNGEVKMGDGFEYWAENKDYCSLNGKAIGEFVCDSITHYEAELWDDETYESIQEIYEPDDFAEYGEYEHKLIADNSDEDWKVNPLVKTSCVSVEELRKYLGQGFHDFYAWHISNIVIYDKPKGLDCFSKSIDCHRGKIRYDCVGCWDCQVTRPPQSWCYVEEREKNA